MSLLRFALTIAGPIDAAINFAMNGAITWYFLHSATALPLLGWFSAEVFLGPMFFLLFSLATFFGVRNGVIARQKGWVGLPLAENVAWRGRAAAKGLLNGSVALAAFLLAVRLLERFRPGLTIPAFGLIGLQTLGSAALGYCVQVRGVLASRRL